VDQTHRLILDELEDRVERIFAATEDLREAIGDGKTSRQLLDSIFRNVHSLKASASSNGLDVLTRIAHQFENLLHSLRVGQATLNNPVLQAFDDTAEAMFSSLREESSVNFEELFSRLQLLSEPTARVSRLEVDVILNAVPAEIWQALSEEEKHRLEQSLGEGTSLFLITTRFDIANFDQLFQSLKETLTEKGELISTAPTVDSERLVKRLGRLSASSATEVLDTLQEMFAP
jgi:two-component system chemotaxis sensor kinase CheA